MCLSGQPAIKVRLAASSKQNGGEWAWVVNVSPTTAAVWAECTCEVAGDAAQKARAVLCQQRSDTSTSVKTCAQL